MTESMNDRAKAIFENFDDDEVEVIVNKIKEFVIAEPLHAHLCIFNFIHLIIITPRYAFKCAKVAKHLEPANFILNSELCWNFTDVLGDTLFFFFCELPKLANCNGIEAKDKVIGITALLGCLFNEGITPNKAAVIWLSNLQKWNLALGLETVITLINDKVNADLQTATPDPFLIKTKKIIDECDFTGARAYITNV
jgi:hypothetical protein